MNVETPKPNRSDAAAPEPTGIRSRLRRTLFTAGIFALLAMIYVPTPRERGVHSAGYRFIFSGEDTSIAFFQLLVNVAFAALLGAIVATILARISKRAVYVTAGCIAVVALSVGVFPFTAAAAARAQSDEKNADELLVLYPRDSQTWLTKFRNAVINWRLALRFDEAARVENRIKQIQSSPPPSPIMAEAIPDWAQPIKEIQSSPPPSPGKHTNLWEKDPIVSVDFASPNVPEWAEKQYNPPIAGETTSQWLQRIGLHGLPGNYSMELEPGEPLATLHPFVKPKPEDALYDAGKERDLGKKRGDGGMLLRLYRRGVFAGYSVVKTN